MRNFCKLFIVTVIAFQSLSMSAEGSFSFCPYSFGDRAYNFPEIDQKYPSHVADILKWTINSSLATAPTSEINRAVNLLAQHLRANTQLGLLDANNTSVPKVEISNHYQLSIKPTVTVVIPTRNEAGGIKKIIESVRPFAGEILVIDGHSTDNTREIARKENVKVVLDGKKGKGEAIRLGLKVASNDIVVFIDADGSHDAADIPKLVEPIFMARADLVVGSRMLGGSDELYGSVPESIRMIGSTIITQIINIALRKHFTDYQNGFRAIRREVGLNLNLRSDITTIEQEMDIKAIRKGYIRTEVATHEYSRQWGSSKIYVLKVWHKYLWSLFTSLFSKN